MTLSAIRDFLSRERRASLNEIAGHFGADPELVRPMLEQWVRKGRVAVRTPDEAVSGCCGNCARHAVVRYEWVG